MWTYHRPASDVVFEIGQPVHVTPQPLRVHLHSLAQLLVIVAGRRSMRVGFDEVVVWAGEVLVLPGGVAHGPGADAHGTWSGFNLYIAPARVTSDVPLIVSLPVGAARDVLSAIEIGDRADAAFAGASVGRTVWSGSKPAVPTEATFSVRRETRIRRFASAVGLPPATHARMVRLDKARRLLAQGVSPAEVAAAAGFADQSHLGRLFRAAYGTSPARYAAGR